MDQQKVQTQRARREHPDPPTAQEESSLKSSIGQANLTRENPEHLVYARTFGGLSGARDQIRTGDSHVGKEMLPLISLRLFA